MNNCLIDLTILEAYPEALAKVTEALAKVYFDNILDKSIDVSEIDKAYTIAFNLCPNYRLILQNKSGFEKYKSLNPDLAKINSLPVYKKDA